jgi:putative peptidoglycan lipid II flippase
LLYQRGEFTSSDTTVVAQCLQAFSFGLVFNGWMLILNRGFYAVQTNWIPTSVALGNLALNALLDALFYHFGIWGIPLATSAVNVAGTATLLVAMRRRVGLGGLIVWVGLDAWLGRGLGGQVVSLAVALAVAAAGYIATGRVLGVRELEALLLLRSRSPGATER